MSNPTHDDQADRINALIGENEDICWACDGATDEEGRHTCGQDDPDRYTFGRYTVTAYGESGAEVASDTALLLVTLVEQMHLPHTSVVTIRVLPSGDRANSVVFTVVTDSSDDGGVFGPDGQLVLDTDRAAAYTQAAAVCVGVA